MNNNDPVSNDDGSTISFTEYRKKFEENDNIWWMTSSGHQLNLFEEACSIIDDLKMKIKDADDALDDILMFDEDDLRGFATYVRSTLGEVELEEDNE